LIVSVEPGSGLLTAAINSPSVAKSVSLAETITAPPCGSACTLTRAVNPPGFCAVAWPICAAVWFTMLAITFASTPSGNVTMRRRSGSAGICRWSSAASAVARSTARLLPEMISELVAGSTAMVRPSSSAGATGWAA
jgi:hypothetical protein